MSTDSKTQEVIDKLNDLIEKNYDAEKGYKEATSDVENPELQDFFTKSTKQRYDFGHEIKTEIKKLGGEVKKGTSLAGDIHRIWIDLKSAITGKDEEAVLNECERGEKYAIEEYEEALKQEGMPESAKEVIRKHLVSVRASLAHLESLKTRFANT